MTVRYGSSSRFNDHKYDEFRTNLGQIALIVFRNM